MTPDQALFTIVLAAAAALFAFSCVRRFSLVGVGGAEDRFDRAPMRLLDTFVYAFAQKRVLQKPFGINHFILFWSFLVLLLANGEFVLKGINPALTLMALPPSVYAPLYFAFDLVSLFALICVIAAAVRRTFAPPYPGAATKDAYFILGMIAALMIAYFNLHGLEIASGETAPLMPVSAWVGSLFYSGITPQAVAPLITFWWWTHAAIFLVFLNYLPYSKHMHILSSIPSVYLRRHGKANTLPREVFETGQTFGAAAIDDLTWKDLFDSYSCTECGRCQLVCPASVTGKPLNPRQVIHDLKLNLIANGPDVKKGRVPKLPLIGEGEGSIAEDAIWSCTSCGACMEVCPVFIEQMPKLLKMRRHLVEMKAEFPEELLSLFENMEQRSNPWGMAPSERTKWCSAIEAKPFDESCEYLLYVGCAGAFDSRNKQTTVALAKILDAAGISWGILGKDEGCCGDSVRRLGNEFVFDAMARANVAMFAERGVKKIITLCPHCYSTLANDYRDYGFEGEVISHAELIEDLLATGALRPSGDVSLGTAVFHDSCYLGRHNGIYDAPRSVLAALTGAAPAEMERNRARSFCCGAGGGRMWMEEAQGTRINLERVKEALEEEPDTICVTCPYCMTMFEDGLKDEGADHVMVRDIAEVVALGL